MARSGFVCRIGRKKGEPAVKGLAWYFLADVAPEGAKRKQVKRGGFATKSAAQEALTKLLAETNEGVYVPPSRQNVTEFVGDWLAAIASTVRPSTLASYQRNLEQHVVPFIGNVPLRSLDAGQLNALYSQLLAGGRRDSKNGGLSPRTVRYVATILHRALKDAVRWRRIPVNPAAAADPPRAKLVKESQPAMKVWAAAELVRFLIATSASRYQPAWLTLATTGMRRGELLGLMWDDVDLLNGRLSIRRALVVIDHVPQVGPTKTGKPRVIELDAATVAALKAWKSRQAQEHLLMGVGYQDTGLVFTHPDGRPYHPERFSREFDRAVERHGLERIRLHDLRHGWATMALEQGVHVKVVSERLGHSSVVITLDTYSHVSPAMASDAAERVSSLIFGGSKG
jgi:integrase